MKPRRRPKRSASCESWDSFQKPLRHILNRTTVRDLNTTEQILKLIFDFDVNSKNNDSIDEAFQTFQNYIKVQALRKASETVVDWNTLKQTFLMDTSQTEENYVDRNSDVVLSPPPPPETKSAGSFEVLATSHSSKSLITPTPFNCEMKSMANHMEPTTTTVDGSVEPIVGDSNLTENNISINSVLDFNSSSSTETNDDLSIFNNVDPIKSNDLLMFSKNLESFKKRCEVRKLKTKKPKKSFFRSKKTNFKRTASPFLNNETFLKLKNLSKNSRRSCGSRTSQFEEDFQMSKFEEDFQQFLKTSIQQKNKVPKIQLFTQAKPSSNNLEKLISNDIITRENVKPQPRTSFIESFETDNILEWFEQYNKKAEQTVDDSNLFLRISIDSS
ncbi:uncharacterized protein LOC129940695 isoform X2 [Eupeodes corollae]|uniref:uncharacterized protein LOC129940695 isoform X2 n=1 Tax=Eupeodes corollae TaxID=290404 RepID=UPI00248F8561|nr:uncharacterized protein LOC129940695 isoform X2 [Eupeodes corollae]